MKKQPKKKAATNIAKAGETPKPQKWTGMKQMEYDGDKTAYILKRTQYGYSVFNYGENPIRSREYRGKESKQKAIRWAESQIDKRDK